MLVLGLQGSPRRKGNTAFMLNAFLSKAKALGAKTRLVEVDRYNIVVCKEYTVCEKKGFCPIKDDMQSEIYGLLRQAEVVVAASPIFFYHMTAQLKGLVDRCQLFWARKYKLRLNDPGYQTRQGFFMGVAATKGANLFTGSETTAKIFFDAIGAGYGGSLNFRGIEHARDLEKQPAAIDQINRAAEKIVAPLMARKNVLFIGQDNAGLSQMASVLARYRYGSKIAAVSAAQTPAAKLKPEMTAALQARGIDMAFLAPQSLETVRGDLPWDMVVTLNKAENLMPDVDHQVWEIEAPAAPTEKAFGRMADEIERRLANLKP